MRVAVSSQNLDPKIVVSGISTVVRSILECSKKDIVVFEVGYRDGDRAKSFNWLIRQSAHILVDFPRFLCRERIDVVHLCVPLNTLGIIRERELQRAAIRRGLPVITHIHGGRFLMERPRSFVLRSLIGTLLKSSHCVLSLSDVESKSLAKLYGFHGAVAFPNAVDTDYYKPSPSCARSDSLFHILYLGRITESKGVEDIVEAFRRVYPTKRFRFTVAGTGPLEKRFLTACAEVMGADFCYAGVVTGDQKLQLMQACDAMVLPSRHSEGLPMSLLEAMSCAIVPIVSNNASMATVVQNQVNGLLVKPYDSQHLSEQLIWLLEHQGSHRYIADAARDKIIDEYGLNKYIMKLDLTYDLLESSFKRKDFKC